jgi:hypothetical protein
LVLRELLVLRPTCLALLAITLATLHCTRTGEATTIPIPDLGCVASCISNQQQNNGDFRLLPVQRIDQQAGAPTSPACEDRPTSECVHPENGARSGGTPQGIRYFEDAVVFSKSELEAKAFDLNMQIRNADLALATRSCANPLEGQPDSPDEDCDNVRAGSDYTETVSVLTVAIISALVLALMPVGWVMHRSYRLWRMRRYGAVGNMARWRVSPVAVQKRRLRRRSG